MSEAHESTARLPEHTARMDWAKLTPEAFKGMLRLDAASHRGVDARQALKHATGAVRSKSDLRPAA
ncbi:hypothetical protein OOK58_54360 [Streptomyces sp. NBC_01728]|uniref:hypothetical protein n=1 Tax=unclassified Streptomyces TaxID=2593676 RepID=UPI0022599AB8|nr:MULTISPECIES: hypothetical protein [unclassified Streptomyces]MCX4500044.1 hypothetical protein [Streptomyces sp. NBC_01728]